LQSGVISVAATRLNKRLLFEICVVVAYFISFKPWAQFFVKCGEDSLV